MKCWLRRADMIIGRCSGCVSRTSCPRASADISRDDAKRASLSAPQTACEGRAMPRDIPIGNGRLLVTFDDRYQIRDVYFPHVGQENHAGAGPCRFGIWADVPGKAAGQLLWTSDHSWTIRQRYLRDTLTTSVALDNR